MQSKNQVNLIGNVGHVELKAVGDTHVLQIRLATSKSWKDKSGNKQERTTWHNCELWGKRAQGLSGFISKGDSIWLDGELQTDEYEKNGEKRYSTKIRVDEVGLGGRKGGGGGQQDDGENPF